MRSAIDFIPDFIPVLVFVDDLLIVSGGMALAFENDPCEVLSEARYKVKSGCEYSKKSRE